MDTEIRNEERQQKIEALAAQVMGLARDNMIMHLRFLDTATASLRPVPGRVSDGVACDGTFLYYDPAYVLRT